MDLLAQLNANLAPGPAYEDDVGAPSGMRPPVRAIAFYLPQFHPIPENDAAWGKGFTEWTNVTRALPRFVGHYQPQLPGPLGFYDLRQPGVLRQQAALARRYGIGGFCFHYYWFGGKRLLETPLNLLLADPGIDLPFCINWANESWTRRWDQRDRDIIQEQRHSPADDVAFAEALAPIVRDPRYIRIDGRPLVAIYRPDLLPSPKATVQRWRAVFAALRLGDPYIAMCHAFEATDPRKYGMDAAIGFPLHVVGVTPEITASARRLDPNFKGRIRSYQAMADKACALPLAPYAFFHGVCPGWDNEARQPARGVCYAGASPKAYGAWLSWAARRALAERTGEARIVFVNAWNEWAEGAHLEPDRHFGYAYLAETARVLAALGAQEEVST